MKTNVEVYGSKFGSDSLVSDLMECRTGILINFENDSLRQGLVLTREEAIELMSQLSAGVKELEEWPNKLAELKK